MSKRRYDSTKYNLDGVIIEYLKRRKCEKTLVMFQNQSDSAIVNSSRIDVLSGDFFQKFEEFLKNKFTKNETEEDLGFEINFASFQNEPKVSQVKFSRILNVFFILE